MRALKTTTAAVITLCGLVATIAITAPADAYVREGFRFKGGKVTYYNSVKAQDAAVKRAVKAWNASGAKIKIARTSKSKARVRITYLPNSSCYGLARTSTRGGRALRATIYLPRPTAGIGCTDEFVNTIVVAHELGHVLGLGHEGRTCALMNPRGTRQGGELCQESTGTPAWVWRCRILEPDDVRGAVRIYGGTVKTSKFAPSPWCPLYAEPAPPAGLTATAAGGRINITMTRPADPVIPDWLLAERRDQGGVDIAVAAGACPTQAQATGFAWPVAPGQAFTRTYPQTAATLAPGSYCVAAWAVDQMGRPSQPAIFTPVTV